MCISCGVQYSFICSCVHCFFFNDPATTEFYTLSLHDALPISILRDHDMAEDIVQDALILAWHQDRKSTRLNSSHRCISYAVFCLKKKSEKSEPLHVSNREGHNALTHGRNHC